MNTRTTENSDPANAPERNLSSARLRPIAISLAVVAQSARTYAKEAREACLWLANLAANSQRIQLCWQRRLLADPIGTVGRITEVELCEKVGLHREDVYAALTGHDSADLPKFVAAVNTLRADFESKLPPLVRTADSRTIAEAFEVAGDEHRIAVVQGKWRHGKTEECERRWLLNLHRCVWLHCPSDNTERTFLTEFARALGIGANISKRPPLLRQQIKNALGIGLIDTVIVDEAHFLWPGDLVSAKPTRAEFIRELRDSLGVGFVLVTTDQFALAMEVAKQHNTRYAPGQLAGRRYQFQLRDTHTDKEIRAIAALHAGNATDEALEGFLAFARSEEGYLGQMIEAIATARHQAGNHGAPITAAHVTLATKQQQTSDRVKQLVTAIKPPRRGRMKLLAA
jgi:DNA transposition AAA+ family ATPase